MPLPHSREMYCYPHEQFKTRDSDGAFVCVLCLTERTVREVVR